MYVDLHHSHIALCPRQLTSAYAHWIIYVQVAHLGCFSSLILFVILKLTLLRPKRANISAYMVALSIVSVGFVSTTLSLSSEFGGICVDSFG